MKFLSPFERMVAWRYLKSRRREGFVSVIAWFSLIGIALGVATLIVVMAVMNGFRADLLGRIIGIKGHIALYAHERSLGDFDNVAAQIRKVPGVLNVIPLVEGQVMATASGVSQGVAVAGFRYSDLMHKKLIVDNIKLGDMKAFERAEGVIIGDRLAQKMNLGIGDSISLMSLEGRSTAIGMMPRIKAYPIVAMFNVGMFEYDSALVIMPFEEAQIYFKLRDNGRNNASALEINTTGYDDALPIARKIDAITKGRYLLYDWQQSNKQFFNAVQVERNVMFLILTLIIVVAAFNIISSLIMLVNSKGRDIAILRTMGASRNMIMRIFFACGASIGVMGTLAGLALGVAFAENIGSIQHALEKLSGRELFAAEIYFLSTLPARVDYQEVAQVVVMALGLSFLATIYPARRAAKLDPAEALRYE